MLLVLLPLFYVCAVSVLVYRDGTWDEFPQQTGTFGPQPGSYDVNGTLTHYAPNTTLCSPPQGTPFTNCIILVLRGGNCTFFQKTINAQNGGALGIIVGNSEDDSLVTMGAADGDPVSTIVIPAVFVGKSTWNELEARIPSAPQTILNQAGEIQDDFWTQLLRTGGIAIGFVIAFILLYTCMRYCRERRQRSVRVNVATRLPLLAFDVEAHQAGQGLSSGVINNACAICLEDFTGSSSVKVLPCRHGFHVPCIDEWLSRSDLCPICKHNVLDVRPDDPLFRDMLNQNRRCPCCRCC